MSEPKFRAWNKLAHKMAIIDALDFALDSYRAHAGKSSGSGHLADIELMQFTGYKDKHGVEIYEGDIIKADWHWEEPHIIKWPHDYYALLEYGLDDGLEVLQTIEVIGNCYETPELVAQEVSL